jgi:hypothetical protein
MDPGGVYLSVRYPTEAARQKNNGRPGRGKIFEQPGYQRARLRPTRANAPAVRIPPEVDCKLLSKVLRVVKSVA